MGTAGDVNGDGYADVIVGARYYDNGQTDEGRAYVYHGSATGLERDRRPGPSRATRQTRSSASRSGTAATSTATAMPTSSSARTSYDNGQTDEGRAYVYHGSATGLSATRSLDRRERPGRRLLRHLGRARRATSTATAMPTSSSARTSYDNGQTDEGRAYVYHGSASGL